MSQEEQPSTSKVPSVHQFVDIPTENELEGKTQHGSRTQSGEHAKNGSEVEESNVPGFMGLTKRQWLVFFVLLMADFLAGVVYSIKGPFYPREAELKGATATQYGLVFGVFEITKCIASPVYGHFMNRLGSRNVFTAGVLIVALSSVFFGLIDRVDDKTDFVTFSFLIRILEALGNAAFSTAAFTTIICEFPNKIATAFATFETTFGLGLIAGPLLAGVFFEIGGYQMPFILTGVFLFGSAIVVVLLMPHPEDTKNANDVTKNKISDVFQILGLPGVLLAAFAVLIAASTIGYINATLSSHLRQFDLTPVQTGLIFLIYGAIYAIFAPVWGWICDRIQKPRYILLWGSILNTVAFLLIGPAPFFDIDTKIWVTSLGLILQGLGVSAVFVSGFITALKYSISHGFPDTMSTYSVISGLWTSVTALGMFIGPSVGGLLLDNVGFRWGTLLLIGSSALLAMLILTFIIVETMYSSYDEYGENEESEKLIELPSPNEEKASPLVSSYGSIE